MRYRQLFHGAWSVHIPKGVGQQLGWLWIVAVAMGEGGEVKGPWQSWEYYYVE